MFIAQQKVTKNGLSVKTGLTKSKFNANFIKILNFNELEEARQRIKIKNAQNKNIEKINCFYLVQKQKTSKLEVLIEIEVSIRIYRSYPPI